MCKKESDDKAFSGNHHILYKEIDSRIYCPQCIDKVFGEKLVKIDKIPATTTNSIDGYTVDKYISIESVEIVIGTGPISEFTSEISDLFGKRSSAYEIKLANAKKTALKKLKMIADELGGNAIIGVDLDFTEFTGNKIGVIISGTIVHIVRQVMTDEDELLNLL